MKLAGIRKEILQRRFIDVVKEDMKGDGVKEVDAKMETDDLLW